MKVMAVDLSKEKTVLGDLAASIHRTAGIVGVLGLAASALLAVAGPGGVDRVLHSYLVAFAWLLSITLGALFFVQLQHVTRAGWSVVVRRLPESLAMNLPLLAVLMLPILFGMHRLYLWTQAGTVATDALLRWKQPYLNVPFFVVRWVVYFAVWTWAARYFWTRSVNQDRTGDVKLTLQMERTSAPAMVLFALTTNFAAVDLLMSLDPHWYSTIYGVYFFSGGVVGFFALLPILTHFLQRSGRLTASITPEHYHDMGKLVFAFVVFWAYIAFSQYMLIWYANIPEETGWYLVRQKGGWGSLSLLLLFGHFVLPFGYLMTREVKRKSGLLVAGAIWMLLMHWVDIYWLAIPGYSPGRVPWHLADLTCTVGLGGIALSAAAWRLRATSLLPAKDPRLAESLAFENA